MSLSPAQITLSAEAMIRVANLLKEAYVLGKEYSSYNSVTDPGWNNLQATPSPPVDSTTHLISGTNAQPADISNAIGSLNQFLNYWEGSAVTTSAWGQNLEKLSNPLVT